MTHILITGASGQVGQEFQTISTSFPHFQFLYTDIASLDITDQQDVLTFFRDNPIDFCINCAAYTAVDKAESEPELAQLINVKGVQNLALACREAGSHLIHFSTDYVYHNNQNTPFIESDPTSPKGVYAKTKLEGEQEALSLLVNTTIIRTSWVYSTFGHNFVKTMLRLGKERTQLNVVFDQIGSPTYALHLAQATLNIIQQIERKTLDRETLSGIFHYSNEGVCSWYDFALAIFELNNISCQVNPIETKDYPTPAQRPPFSLLNKTKIKSTFNLQIPHWRTALKTCLEKLEPSS